ncbi:Gfo/Idh/MocA family protein [Paenibacillus eucommiae]|uniref:Dehydrogenase n=1 Tax=Paenibacillus eucommiae TaxID=1355755 RepID=A0ABS4ILK9_9BACL|nr:Gfo/Idh/MocA family oxidoreductase [Paenibacillus eucommiae]MBP1988429.1 putative dehydrogenase [Paenibacillus eucommiae]
MQQTLKLGMIGLDTSHVSAFAAILNDPQNPYHVPGGKIEIAYPGVPSPDFELSYGRVDKYTSELKEQYGVTIVDSAEAVAEQSDAILIVSVDGRVHLDLLKKVAPFGKPVFVDKPFAVSSKHAEEMFAIAAEHKIPLMSCSSLRYAQGLVDELGSEQDDVIIGADCFGPMSIEPTQPGLFWYGIHSVEMLFTIMGKGCANVSVTTTDEHDVVVGTWKDGRIGVVRGNREGNYAFSAAIQRKKTNSFVDTSAHPKPAYAGMLERILLMFQTGKPDVDSSETLEIIRFLEAANESRDSGKKVELAR